LLLPGFHGRARGAESSRACRDLRRLRVRWRHSENLVRQSLKPARLSDLRRRLGGIRRNRFHFPVIEEVSTSSSSVEANSPRPANRPQASRPTIAARRSRSCKSLVFVEPPATQTPLAELVLPQAEIKEQ
jgi:hypothetical protein